MAELEKTPLKKEGGLRIDTTVAFGEKLAEIAKKMECDPNTVVGEILSIGCRSMKEIADGKNNVVVLFRNGKTFVEGFKDIPTDSKPVGP
jgi:hypothetical protein